MSGAHALLAPSSAARWVACAGSVLLEALYPEQAENPEAAEGTASHWGAYEMFYGRLICEGQVAPNGIVLSQEMIEGTELYVDAVDKRLAEFGLTRDVLRVEQRVEIPDVHEQNWGTPDCWFYAFEAHELDVFDYKFGHRYVDVFENWQLIDYACGILSGLGIDGHADQKLRVNLHVVQPRSYHRDGPVQTWSVMASELRGYFNILRNAAEAALRPGALCTPNPECFDCKARHACEANQRDAYSTATISRASLPLEMPAAALGLELHFLRNAAHRLKARITGLEQQAEMHILRGEVVPYSAMVPTQGREVWAKPIAEVFALGELFAINLAKAEAITPKQAIKAGIPAEVVTMYSEVKRGMTLAADDGKQARKVFAK